MTKDEILLRPIQVTDCDVIINLLAELAAITGLAGKVSTSLADLKAAAFSPQPLMHGIIAEKGEDGVGICLYYPQYSSWRGDAGVYILDLYVKQDLHGCGLGRRLIKHTAQTAAEKWGAIFTTLDVDSDNKSAQIFYEKMGFEMYTANKNMIAYTTSF